MNVKNYQIWHWVKSKLHNQKPRVYFHQKEIWFCYLGENIGFEQDGKGKDFLRPIIIIRKFNKEIFWGVPLTTNSKQGQYYFSIDFGRGPNNVILSQLRLIDCKRLKYKIGTLREDQFYQLTKRLKDLIP